MLKAIFFDLDDTLENWNPARAAIREKISAYVNNKFGIGKERFLGTFHDVEYSFVGKSPKPADYSRKVWFSKTFRKLKIKISNTEAEKLEKLYWKTGLAKIRLNAGAKKVLKSLKKFRLVLVSDSDGDSGNTIKNRKIRILRLRKYFDLIVTSNDTGKNKPDKKLWKVALKKFSLNPSECMMVGDKPEMDLKPTKEMGFATVWMKTGQWASMRKGKKFKYVDHEITKLGQLLGII